MPFLLVLSIIPCFGQETQDTAVQELKQLNKEIAASSKQYDSLSDAERDKLNVSCELSTSLYRYLLAKDKITALDSITVETLCNRVVGQQILASLKDEIKVLKDMEVEFEKYLGILKPSRKDADFEEAIKKIGELKTAIVERCSAVKELREELAENGTVDLVLDDLDIPTCVDYNALATEANENSKNFIIVGINDPIDSDSLLKQESAKAFFKEVIEVESKTRLGTFEILPDESEVELYVKAKRDKLGDLKNSSEIYVKVRDVFKPNGANFLKKSPDTEGREIFRSAYVAKVYKELFDTREEIADNGVEFELSATYPKKVRFKSIAFETREGGMVDIRLQVLSLDKKVELYFENEAPVSMLNFTRRAKRSFLVFSNKFNDWSNLQGYDYRFLDQLYIRVSDVIKYLPDEGNNFVPEDIALKLPKDTKAEDAGSAPRKYQLINNSSLSNLLDLRAYTDFLGLFADESNGLFQIEGKTDFFLNPFNFNRSSIYLLKKATPFIRYSRLEEENSFIPASLEEGLSQFDDSRLELLEKSNLEFGLDVNVFSFRLFKESPIWLSFHIPVNVYNTKIRPETPTKDDMPMEPETTDDEGDINFSTLGLGFGASIEVRRLSNFGLNLGYSFRRYSPLGDYSVEGIKEPDNFGVNSLDAEIFYYPGKDERQSIFLRMRGFRETGSNGAAFQQIQFGYRFTLGLNKIKAKD